VSKFKINFTLKQHTPLIHFQSEQSGATLRATELKPKFDRFLIEMFEKEQIDYKGFLISGQERALDYKVSINSTLKKNNILFKTYISKKDRENKALKIGSYFGDFKALESSIIKIEFFSFNSKIIDYINQYFNEFISTHAFGTRTSKGFGNYTNEKTTQKQFEEHLEKHFILFKKTSEREPLQKILKEYQALKSGVSGSEKSELMKFFLSNEIRWEKRWIKKQLNELKPDWFADLKDEYHDKNGFFTLDNEKYFFLRAMLGVSENNEFLVNSNSKDKLVVKIKNSEIERFASPIIYKIFNNNVYMLLNKKNPIDKRIFNKEFQFTAYYKNNKNEKCELGSLTTPNSFDIEQFLKEVN
jgi:hypothetical protein